MAARSYNPSPTVRSAPRLGVGGALSRVPAGAVADIGMAPTIGAASYAVTGDSEEAARAAGLTFAGQLGSRAVSSLTSRGLGAHRDRSQRRDFDDYTTQSAEARANRESADTEAGRATSLRGEVEGLDAQIAEARATAPGEVPREMLNRRRRLADDLAGLRDRQTMPDPTPPRARGGASGLGRQDAARVAEIDIAIKAKNDLIPLLQRQLSSAKGNNARNIRQTLRRHLGERNDLDLRRKSLTRQSSQQARQQNERTDHDTNTAAVRLQRDIAARQRQLSGIEADIARLRDTPTQQAQARAQRLQGERDRLQTELVEANRVADAQGLYARQADTAATQSAEQMSRRADRHDRDVRALRTGDRFLSLGLGADTVGSGSEDSVLGSVPYADVVADGAAGAHDIGRSAVEALQTPESGSALGGIDWARVAPVVGVLGAAGVLGYILSRRSRGDDEDDEPAPRRGRPPQSGGRRGRPPGSGRGRGRPPGSRNRA